MSEMAIQGIIVTIGVPLLFAGAVYFMGRYIGGD